MILIYCIFWRCSNIYSLQFAMTVEGMNLQSLWYFIGGLPQFKKMERPFPGTPQSVKNKFGSNDYSIWTHHQGEAIFGFNSKMTTEEFHKRVIKYTLNI